MQLYTLIIVLVLALGLAFAAAAQSETGSGATENDPQNAVATQAEESVDRGTAKHGDVLEEVSGRTPDAAQGGLEKAREASRQGREKALDAIDRDRANGGETAESSVDRGTAQRDEVLEDTSERVPDRGQPGIQKSRGASQSRRSTAPDSRSRRSPEAGRDPTTRGPSSHRSGGMSPSGGMRGGPPAERGRPR